MDEIPSDKWERLMQVNLLAPMRLSTLFMTDMIAQQQGHIVNTFDIHFHTYSIHSTYIFIHIPYI